MYTYQHLHIKRASFKFPTYHWHILIYVYLHFNIDFFLPEGYFETLRAEGGNRNINVTMICPGPVVSSILVNAYTDKLGKQVNQIHDSSSKRMSTARCAHLIAVAIANKLDESWLEIQPILTFHYFGQYFPSTSRKIFSMIDSRYYRRLRDGDALQ